ncbi:MAG TPA: PQQ-dependent sugar dehydrogenase [Thermoanaerobaculia bacterium]|nr:PQQ-dependent sugar dehydrogenase [Thermoanaerobaculia bacterium]
MRATLALLLVASALPAAVLPGFRVQTVGTTAGFASSIAIDSRGTIYYTTTNGNLFRFLNGQSTLVSHVNTVAIGNSGLLGLALRDDNTAIVHYTTPGQVSDVLSAIDLVGGTETVMQSFVCDKDVPLRGSPAEHHGGNPSVASDGSIFVGIGDYGGRAIAALPEWNGGKIFRIHPDGSVEQFARGFRNPFDMVWDASKQRLIAPDNGDLADDEINIVHAGDFCGWPFTMGNGPVIEGAVPPIYTFPTIVAPTGIIAVNGRNPYFKSGYLLGGFVTKSVYYIPDIDARPFPDPIALVWGADAGLLIDVAQTSGGDVYFVTPNAIKRLLPPQPGDCNGDGLVDAADIAALTQELADGNPHPTWTAQDGAFRGSWGCDVDQNGVIDSRDLAALLPMIRSRAVRAGGSPAAHP